MASEIHTLKSPDGTVDVYPKTVGSAVLLSDGSTVQDMVGNGVKYTPQTLNDSQKAQARENIGAMTVVRLTKEEYDALEEKDDYSLYDVLDDGSDCLTIEAINATDVYFIAPTELGVGKIIEVSTDGGVTWVQKASSLDGTVIASLEAGEKVLLRGNNPAYGYYDEGEAIGTFFAADDYCYVYGNVMSLVGGGTTVQEYAFTRLFSDYNEDWDGSWLHSKPGKPILLPATTLAEWCYFNMFSNCTSLTTAPELPATTLAEYCYDSMFNGCTSLTTAPTLPATTLASSCYSHMFAYCSSLTTAPALPATTLAEWCYYSMFNNCTSLTSAPALHATTLAQNCYGYMFAYCSSLTTAPSLPATTMESFCYSGMFCRCTSLTTAPTLPATTLAKSCYDNMFSGCSSLNYVKALFTTIGSSSLLNWLYNVSATGTFVKHPDATIPSGVSGIPSGWTVETATE